MRGRFVDEDGSEASKEFVGRLKMSDSIKLIAYSFDEARNAVRQGKLVAYVRMTKGYGSSQGFLSGDPAKIEVGIDPSKRTEKGFLKGILMEATFGGLQDKMSNTTKTRKQVQSLLGEIGRQGKAGGEHRKLVTFLEALDGYLGSTDGKTLKGQMKIEGPKIEAVRYSGRKRPKTSFEVSFPQAVVWGLLGIVATFATLIARERVIGTLLRLRISPLSWWHILAGKGLAAFLACVAIIALIFVVGRVGFGLRLGLGSLPQLLSAIVATAWCVTGLVMLISTLGKTEQAVGGASWAVMMPLAMFGGGMIPLFMMPGWMQSASHFSPVKWAVYSFEGAIWRDFTASEMLLPCGVLVATGAVAFALGVTILSRAKV